MDENKIIWHGCYDDSWQGIIVPESFAHPAKMAYGLTRKIFKHALSEAWIKPGDVVVDPFGGIGSTGIVGACFGLRVVCVELEQKFVDLANKNFKRNSKYIDGFKHFGHPYQPVILQGDSRRLSEIISGADCLIGSPPFSVRQPPNSCETDFKNLSKTPVHTYGQTPGQLGGIKPGEVSAVIGSPPYAESLTAGGHLVWQEQGKIGAHKNSKGKDEIYGTAPGNLGNLKPGEVDAVVSSPPYEGSHIADGEAAKLAAAGNARKIPDGATSGGVRYGNTEGNLGQKKGQTFWQAAQIIVSECHKILKPGGYAIWVVKDFVRNKKKVDFTGDWRRLCESCGFETIHVHHAMLVKETKHNGLFGTIVEKTERKSFFRRLAEKKGSPRIDYEVVLCMRRGAV